MYLQSCDNPDTLLDELMATLGCAAPEVPGGVGCCDHPKRVVTGVLVHSAHHSYSTVEIDWTCSTCGDRYSLTYQVDSTQTPSVLIPDNYQPIYEIGHEQPIFWVPTHTTHAPSPKPKPSVLESTPARPPIGQPPRTRIPRTVLF